MSRRSRRPAAGTCGRARRPSSPASPAAAQRGGRARRPGGCAGRRAGAAARAALQPGRRRTSSRSQGRAMLPSHPFGPFDFGPPVGVVTRPDRFRDDGNGYFPRMGTILWIIAVILVIAGIFAIIRRQLIWGIVLIVVGLLVGPGGVSIFT